MDCIISLTLGMIVMASAHSVWHIQHQYFHHQSSELHTLESLVHLKNYLAHHIFKMHFRACQDSLLFDTTWKKDMLIFSYPDAQLESPVYFLSNSQVLTEKNISFSSAPNVFITDCTQGFVRSLQHQNKKHLVLASALPKQAMHFNKKFWLYPIKKINWRYKNGKLYEGREPIAALDDFYIERYMDKLRMVLVKKSYQTELWVHLS